VKVRSQVFVGGKPADAWAAACTFAQAKLVEGYSTVLLITRASELAKRFDLPCNAVMVRYWGKAKAQPKRA
jgi:hypothetical protein